MHFGRRHRRASRPGWVYTAGLLDSADHPELIMAGVHRSSAARTSLATAVIEGTRCEIGATVTLGDEYALIGAVHHIQYRLDTFATWHSLAAEGVLRERTLAAVQVFAPPSWMVGRRRQPVLAQPWAHVDGGHAKR